MTADTDDATSWCLSGTWKIPAARLPLKEDRAWAAPGDDAVGRGQVEAHSAAEGLPGVLSTNPVKDTRSGRICITEVHDVHCVDD